MHTAEGGPPLTDPVLVHYHRAVEAEAQMRRLAMAIGACAATDRRRQRDLLTQEAAAAARFNVAYRGAIDTPAATHAGVVAKFLLHAQCTRDDADPLDDELAASTIADVDRLGLLPLTATLQRIGLGTLRSAAFRDADMAFASAAEQLIPPTPGMVAAGVRAGRVGAEQVRSIFAAMMNELFGQAESRR